MAKAPIPPAPRPERAVPLQPPQNPLLPLPTPEGKVMPPPPKPRTLPPTRDVPVAEGKGPPLFIKIDKYKDVVNQLHRLKTYSLSLRDALDALVDIEKELHKGLSITQHALDKFNTTIAAIDMKITRIPPQDADGPPGAVDHEIDDYVAQLHNQMEKIKEDLKNISP